MLLVVVLVELKLKSCWSLGTVSLTMVMPPQLLTLTGIGAMKSLSAAVKESDERLFRYAWPKLTQAFGWKTPEPFKSMAASPKVLSRRVALLSRGFVVLSPSLTAPLANSAALRSWRLPQQ